MAFEVPTIYSLGVTRRVHFQLGHLMAHGIRIMTSVVTADATLLTVSSSDANKQDSGNMYLHFRAMVITPIVVIAMAILSACGGGGGSSGVDNKYSISLSPTSLSFSGVQGIPLASQTVTATFRGDGVIVGTLPGQSSLPSWLSVAQASQPSNGQVQFSISANPSSAPVGTSQTMIRFVTGSATTGEAVVADLPITLETKEGFGITNPQQDYRGFASTSTPNRITTGALPAIRGDSISWSARTSASWITINTTSGNAKGPISYTIDSTGLQPGTYYGWITVTDSISARSATVNFTLSILNPQLVITPAAMVFNVDANTLPAQISMPFKITDELSGASVGYSYTWNLKSRSPLLRLSKTSGTTLPGGSDLVVELDPFVLGTTRSTQIDTFIEVSNFQNGSSYNSPVYLPVRISIRLPLAGSIYPNGVTPGSTGTARLIGNDFQDADLARLRVNGQAPIAARRINASEIEIDYSGIAAGQYPITFNNALGYTRSAAELSASGTVTIGTGEVSTAGGRKSRLIFDRSRGVLYASDYTIGEVQRFRWNGSAYDTLPAIAMIGARDIAMSRNNREIYVTSEYQGLYSIDTTTTGTVVPQLLADNSELRCGRALRVATPEDGSIFVTPYGNPCAAPETANAQLAFSPLTRLPSGKMAPFVTGLPSLYDSAIAASPNGRYLTSGTSGLSGGGDYYLHDIRTDTRVSGGSIYDRYSHVTLDVSDSGDRTLVSSLWVRDRTGRNVCDIPTNAIARLNAGGTKAYAYRHVEGGGGRIAVYDTTAVAATCTEIAAESIPVPYDMGRSTGTVYYDLEFALTLVEEQRKVFLSGPARIIALTLQ